MMGSSNATTRTNEPSPPVHFHGKAAKVRRLPDSSSRLPPMFSMPGIPFDIRILCAVYVFGILYLLYTLFGMKSRRDNIGHTAHFGGAVSGFAITLFIFPSLIYMQTNLILLLMIPLIVYLVMKRNGNL